MSYSQLVNNLIDLALERKSLETENRASFLLARPKRLCFWLSQAITLVDTQHKYCTILLLIKYEQVRVQWRKNAAEGGIKFARN